MFDDHVVTAGLQVDSTAYDTLGGSVESPNRIFDAIDTPPCEKYDCPNMARCKSQELACRAFQRSVNLGDVSQTVEDMMNPTRKIYIRLFPDC